MGKKGIILTKMKTGYSNGKFILIVPDSLLDVENVDRSKAVLLLSCSPYLLCLGW